MENLSKKAREKIIQEFETDKSSIETVLNQSKEMKSVSINKQGEIIQQKKRIILADGREIPAYYGRRLKINKRLHGCDYVAKAGTLFDDIPSSFKLKVSFSESDFE